MKVVHIIPSLNKGGAERFMVDLCNELSENIEGKIYLISLNYNDDESTFLSELDEKIEYVSFNKAPGFQLSVLFRLTRFLIKISPDIVHSHLQTFEYLSLYRLLHNKAKFIHTIHSDASKECPNYLIKKSREILYKFEKVVPITISNESRSSFRSYYNLKNDILIYNGRGNLSKTNKYYEIKDKYFSKSDYLYAVHVGRITEAKNQKLLVNSFIAFNKLNLGKTIKLYIIGDVQDQIIYEDLKTLIGESANIVFLGSEFNIVDYLLLADFFCLSSHYEGMPISLIEAMSVGCIPISTSIGGITEMIEDSKTGFLSNDMSVKSYVDSILRFVHAENKEQIKERCIIEYNNKYNIRETAKNYLSIYHASHN